MNKIKKGLVGIVLPGLMAVSGCGSMFEGMRLGGYEPVNLSKSHYAADIEKKAEELAESPNLKDKENAIKGYGSVGRLEEMDRLIRKIINQDLGKGMIYSGFGDKFYKMHKK